MKKTLLLLAGLVGLIVLFRRLIPTDVRERMMERMMEHMPEN